jgi:hypothetical protein
MPKTTQEIWKDRSNKFRREKWYSEEELIKAIDELPYKDIHFNNAYQFLYDLKLMLNQKLGLKR